MATDRQNIPQLPNTAELEEAVKRDRYYHRFRNMVTSTFLTLVVVAAAAVLVAVLFLPVLRIYGKSMNGTLDNGDIVLGGFDGTATVYVNGTKLEEPYLDDKAYGETNIELPYQVPDGRIFVMGDNRSVSIDSRNTSIGCVSEEQIVGKIVYRVWPLSQIGRVR